MCTDFEEVAGGAEQQLKELTKLLKKKYSVETYYATKEVKLSLVHSILSLRSLYEAYKQIKVSKADIVHIHKYNLCMSLTPLLAAKMLKKKTVVTLHDWGLINCNGWNVDAEGKVCEDPTSIKWVFKKSLSNKPFLNKLYDYLKNRVHHKFLKRYADCIIAPSEGLYDELEKMFPKSFVYQIPYFTKGITYKKITKRSNIILFIGRIEKEKGLHILLKAFEKLPKKYKLIVVGTGKESFDLGYEYKKNTRILWMSDQPHMLAMKALYASDLIVIPSVWCEQFGIVGIEALAAGRPVVASDIGGIHDWADGTSELVTSNSVKSLEQGMLRVLNQSTFKLNRKGFENRVEFNEWYNGKQHLYEMGLIYELLLYPD